VEAEEAGAGAVAASVVAVGGSVASVDSVAAAASAAVVLEGAGDSMAHMTLDQLVSQLQAAFGKELNAVVLYGSAAAGEHIPKKSDYNVLVLVDSLDVNRLHAASAAIKAWVHAGNSAPLTLTMHEWRRSADIFPMEYADVLQRHKVLYGSFNTDVRVYPEHLRLQLEHEAMGTLLQLRRGALATGMDAKEQLALLEQSVSTVMVIFRAVLRLRDDLPPTDNIELISRIAGVTGIDTASFERVIRHKRGEAVLRPIDASAVLDAYLGGMQQLVRFLDQFSGKKT
jgi:hypothetical protein